ncbi:MAG: flagellar biosynthetic protein FliO [Rhizobiaceae bacterium]
MEWLQNLLNADDNLAIQLVLITLLLMIGLILIVWIFRRIAGSPSRRAARNRIPRLSITDSSAVDDKRYLVLVRRDNVEHLVLIGGPTDVVVESNIVRVQPATRSEKPAHTAAKQVPEDTKRETLAPTAGLPEAEPQQPASVPAAVPIAATAVAATTILDEPAEPEPVSSFEEPVAEVATEYVETPEIQTIEEQVAIQTEPVIDDQQMPEEFETVQEVPAPEPDAKPEQFSEQLAEATQEPVMDVHAEPEAPAETILEDEISKQLDDALSSETFSVELEPEPTANPEPVEPVKSEPDDDMQRLLDELAGETKEPA